MSRRTRRSSRASIASFLARRPADCAKLADPLGIDDPHLDAGLAAAPWPSHAHSRRSLPSQPCSPGVCEARQPAYDALGHCLDNVCCNANARMHASTLSLDDIDTDDNRLIMCHHPLPSLLGSGSKPLQLFGLRKTPELSLALLQAPSPLGATGSVPATGGWCATARLHILPNLLDTRAQGCRCALHPRSRVPIVCMKRTRAYR